MPSINPSWPATMYECTTSKHATCSLLMIARSPPHHRSILHALHKLTICRQKFAQWSTAALLERNSLARSRPSSLPRFLTLVHRYLAPIYRRQSVYVAQKIQTSCKRHGTLKPKRHDLNDDTSRLEAIYSVLLQKVSRKPRPLLFTAADRTWVQRGGGQRGSLVK